MYEKKSLEILQEYPFSISYENAHDTGEVSCDMSSQFWDETLIMLLHAEVSNSHCIMHSVL